MIKDIIWTERINGNIQTIYGIIDGLMIFSIVRFRNEVFQNENWVMTSHVIPMEMIKDIDSDKLKIKANEILELFVNKLIN
jgi:hypothetical protein